MAFFNYDLFLNFFYHLFFYCYLNCIWFLAVAVFCESDSLFSDNFNNFWNLFSLEDNLFLIKVTNFRLSDNIRNFLLNHLKCRFFMIYGNIVGDFDSFGQILIQILGNFSDYLNILCFSCIYGNLYLLFNFKTFSAHYFPDYFLWLFLALFNWDFNFCRNFKNCLVLDYSADDPV